MAKTAVVESPNQEKPPIKCDEGYYFCHACLEDKLQDTQSPDSRYCKACYDFLLAEAGIIGKSRPSWVPKKPKIDKNLHVATTVSNNRQEMPQKLTDASQDALNRQGMPQKLIEASRDTHNVSTIMSTVKKVKTPRRKQLQKSIPKFTTLPIALIRSLAKQGLGSKAIARKVKTDKGIDTSYKTIQRIISGQRVLEN